MVELTTSGDLTTNEQLVDLFNERAIDLLRLEAGTRNKILKFLDELESELTVQITKISPTGTPDGVKQRKRLGELLKLVQETIRASYRDASTLMTKELREIIDQEYSWTAGAFNQSVGVQFVDGAITRGLLQTLVSDVLIQGAASKDWWSRQAQGLSDRFADEMRKGVAIGETNDQLIARVRGTSAQRGLIDISKSSAERLVRTSVQAAANTGREAMYADNSDIIKALQWSATLDTRTSIYCITRDGHTYSPDSEHKPLDKGPKWLEGPGKIHWNALVGGTLITTRRGAVPIEDVHTGDLVKTHRGEWRAVLARRAKRHESGIIRVIYAQSGRVLRATDDHPVRLADGRWVFVGALEIGDELFRDPESMPEVVRMDHVVDTETQYCPPVGDSTQVAIQRAFKLMAPDVDFERDPQRGYCEVENRCVRMVLRDPTRIERDQSIAHHLFAVADMLQKVGRNRLANLITLLVRYLTTRHALAHTFRKTGAIFSRQRFLDHVRTLRGVVNSHLLRLAGILGTGFLGQPPGPVVLTRWANRSPCGNIESNLFDLRSDVDFIPASMGRQHAVRQTSVAFNRTQRFATNDVASFDQGGQFGFRFEHDPVVALKLFTVNCWVYDLEVADDASYVANGLVVSNCRSTSVPVLKTWRDLGIDMDEVPETTRASADGQVPAALSFEDWLKKQPTARQDTVLGQGKAELWRSGKISFRDLLDQGGRPLTTEELRAKAKRRGS